MTGLESALITIIAASTPILLAASGELVVERSGVLNLGLEGMMLMGAVIGFIFALNPALGHLGGFIAAAGAGAATAALFAVLVLHFRTNQVATGLALTILGTGLSKVIGEDYTGQPIARLQPVDIPVLSDLPLIGPVIFGHDLMVYFTLAMVAAIWWFLYRSRQGLVLRAIGESHDAAHALGHQVLRVRFAAILFGGAMAGLGGAYLSLARTPHWAEGMTAGRGWIALALIVFATWRPSRVLLGAYLFGTMAYLELAIQINDGIMPQPLIALWPALAALNVQVPASFLAMLPYVVTIAVLVWMSRDRTALRKNAPGSLGKPFAPAA
jgi:simple sugar transport system permease protein